MCVFRNHTFVPIKNEPMKLRSDFRAAVLMKNRLLHESGEKLEKRFDQDQQRR